MKQANVKIIRSAKRKRTIQGKMVNGKLWIYLPSSMTKAEEQKWKLFLLRNILRIEHYRLNILFSSMFDKITIDKDTLAIDQKNSVEITQENDYETRRGRERKIDYQKWLEELRLKYPNAYMPWTKSDNNRLKKDFYQEKSIKELSHIFWRKPSAIRSRLRKNGLIED